MHVDTTWKFKEMIEFRDNLAKEYDLDLIVHINQEGLNSKLAHLLMAQLFILT